MQELVLQILTSELFGSTGNYTDLGGEEQGLDNILYGIKDVDFPYFNPDARFGGANQTKIPKGSDDDFVIKAHLNAEEADSLKI